MVVSRSGRNAVARLALEDPQWLPAVRAALAVAERTGNEFAGAWILAELQRAHSPRTWYPNFRRLVTFGVLEKHGESTRGGQRAYYRMPDVAGVRRGLAEIDRASQKPTPHRAFSFAGIGRSSRPDLSAAADSILRDDFPNR